MGRRLVFELGHPAQFPVHGIAVEGPGQFRMLGHMGLNKNGALFRVQTTGDELGIELQGLPAERRRVLSDGDGVLIRDTVKGVIVLLQRNPVAQGAQIVSQGNLSAGLCGAENNLFLVFHNTSVGKNPPFFLSESRSGSIFMSFYLTTTTPSVQEFPR